MNTYRLFDRARVLTSVAFLSSPALAQGFGVERINPAAGAFATIGQGLNDQGAVVGYSQFLGPGGGLRAWRWDAASGLVFLPAPPVLTSWAASDINEAGVIAGDGGFDFGQAWRLDGASYELLGSLPTGDMSTAATLDNAGVVAGTSRNSQSFLTPPIAFAAAPGAPLAGLMPGGFATHNNDAGMLVGYASNRAYRWSPAQGALFLGPLGGKPNTWAWSVNASGEVAGEAANANGNGHVPFLYTEAHGMQEIGNFGGSADALDLNDARLVVGNSGSSLPRPWMWNPAFGLVFLNEQVAAAEQLNLLQAVRVNNAGQILCRAFDVVEGHSLPVLLTPNAPWKTWSNLGAGLAGASGAPELFGSGAGLGSSALRVQLQHAAPASPAFLAYSVERIDLPLFGGLLVPNITLGASGLLPLPTNAAGSAQLATSWPSGWPSGAQLYAQAWVLDAGAPQGVAASNAILSPLP